MYHESFERKLRSLAEGYRKRYGDLHGYSIEDETHKFTIYREQLRPYIVDAVEYMKNAQNNKRTVLVESSQALSMMSRFLWCQEISVDLLSARSGLRQLSIRNIVTLLIRRMHSRACA